MKSAIKNLLDDKYGFTPVKNIMSEYSKKDLERISKEGYSLTIDNIKCYFNASLLYCLQEKMDRKVLFDPFIFAEALNREYADLWDDKSLKFLVGTSSTFAEEREGGKFVGELISEK